MNWKTLALEREGPVARLWLNRPEARNAINQLMLEELEQAFDWLETQHHIKVIVLGGRGPSFCAGADRKDAPGLARIMAPDASARERHWLAAMGDRTLEAMDRVSAVTIARVQGHAIGGGLLLALACDFRLAAEGTVFFVPEVDLASPLDWRGVPRLIRAVGATRAKEMVIMCQRVDAAQAERWGLVNRCVPADQLDREMADWTQRLIGKPELVLRLCKAQFRAYGATLPLGDASQFETSLLLESLADERARASFGLG